MRINLSRIADLIAAVPALLGFVPHDSLVLVTTITRPDGCLTIGPCLRMDLADVEHDPRGHIAHCADTLTRLTITGVIGIVIGHTTTSPATRGVLPFHDTVAELTGALGEHELVLTELVHVPEIADKARWQSYRDSNHAGVLPDPRSSVAAVAMLAATGQSVAANRDEHRTRNTPTPAPTTDRARLRPHIHAALATANTDQHQPHAAQARLARADTAIHHAASGRLPTDDTTLADLVATLATPSFREAILSIATSPANTAAEHLARHLWSVTPESHSNDVLAAIVALAYSRGDLLAAHTTLDTATTSTLPLLELLRQCLHTSVPPTDIHRIIANAGHAARRALTTPAAGNDNERPTRH